MTSVAVWDRLYRIHQACQQEARAAYVLISQSVLLSLISLSNNIIKKCWEMKYKHGGFYAHNFSRRKMKRAIIYCGWRCEFGIWIWPEACFDFYRSHFYYICLTNTQYILIITVSSYTCVISKVLHTVRFLFINEFILQNTFTGLKCNLHCALSQRSSVWASIVFLSGRLRCWCVWLLGSPH